MIDHSCSSPNEVDCPLPVFVGKSRGPSKSRHVTSQTRGQNLSVRDASRTGVLLYLAQRCPDERGSLLTTLAKRAASPASRYFVWLHHQSTPSPEEGWILPKLDRSVVPHVHQVAELGAPVLKVGRVNHACMCRGIFGHFGNGYACKASISGRAGPALHSCGLQCSFTISACAGQTLCRLLTL